MDVDSKKQAQDPPGGRKRGRPSLYTPEIGAAICERVLIRPLRAVCQDEDMPAEGTVYGWFSAHPEFAEAYARARKLRAFRRVEDIDEIVEQVKSGVIDPAAARVAIDAIKWQASKEEPRVFGEKIEATHEVGESITKIVREIVRG